MSPHPELPSPSETMRKCADTAAIAADLPINEVDSFPSYESISNGDLFALSLSNRTSNLTHGLHRFAAKYIPQIPNWALGEFARDGDTVLDPFMGSGTTLVEGLKRPGTTIGVDIDPLARFITRVKTTPLDTSNLLRLTECIRARWTDSKGPLTIPMAGVDNFSHWFSDSAWRALQGLYETIDSLECSDSEREFFFAVFSSIVRWVSNADDQTQKTYVSGTLPKCPPDVYVTFWRSLQRAITGMQELAMAASPSAVTEISTGGDARTLPAEKESVDLIVTSPPYLDSVDYMYNFMLEYFWLGKILGVSSRPEFNGMRRRSIGAKNPETKYPELPDSISDLVETSEVNARRLPAVIAYCHEMKNHFADASRVMKDGAKYTLVVGNSQTGKGILPVHDALIRLAAESNLKLDKAFGYRIRRHYMKFPRKGRGGIILIDWVIVLSKARKQVSTPDRLPLPWLKLGKDDVAH